MARPIHFEDTMMQTNRAPTIGAALAPPLRVQPDMPALWKNLRTDFDSAASMLVDEHKADGNPIDLPVLDLATWAMVPVDGQFALAPLGRHYSPKLLRANAFAQLMTRLGAPAEFLRRLPEKLQLATSNFLLASSERSSSTLLRLRGGEISAVVSERYCPLDAELLLDCVRAALVQQDALSQVQVTSVATGIVDAVRLVFPAEEKAIKVGDVSALGLDITSSSFGRSALTVRGILWRLKCTNGLRVAEPRGSFSFRHVGRDQERMRNGLAEAIPSVLAVTRGTMARWSASVTTMVEDVAGLIDGLRDLTVAELKAVQHHVQQEVGTSRLPERAPLYDVLNGVTAAAQDFAPARRLEVEGIAGELLTRHTRGVA